MCEYHIAIEFFNKAIALDPKAVYFNNRADCKANSKDYQGAISDYTIAIQLEPLENVYWFNRGTIHWNYRGWDAAQSDWEKAKELGSDLAAELLERHRPKDSDLPQHKSSRKPRKSSQAKKRPPGKKLPRIIRSGIVNHGFEHSWFIIERKRDSVLQRGLLSLVGKDTFRFTGKAILSDLDSLEDLIDWYPIEPEIDPEREDNLNNMPKPRRNNRSAKMNFGLYECYTIGIVYAFDPDYIEWCIRTIDDFYIRDLEELIKFKVYNNSRKYTPAREIGLPNVFSLIDAYEFIEELDYEMRACSREFIFSPDLVELNAKKREVLFGKA